MRHAQSQDDLGDVVEKFEVVLPDDSDATTLVFRIGKVHPASDTGYELVEFFEASFLDDHVPSFIEVFHELGRVLLRPLALLLLLTVSCCHAVTILHRGVVFTILHQSFDIM